MVGWLQLSKAWHLNLWSSEPEDFKIRYQAKEIVATATLALTELQQILCQLQTSPKPPHRKLS
jgi:hypothetical protein